MGIIIIIGKSSNKNKSKQCTFNLVLCRNIPFVLLTNGGGVTEEEKARQISELVGIKVKK
jgi:ribonucleotide monophosphatase NagD (HAD superfamily)